GRVVALGTVRVRVGRRIAGLLDALAQLRTGCAAEARTRCGGPTVGRVAIGHGVDVVEEPLKALRHALEDGTLVLGSGLATGELALELGVGDVGIVHREDAGWGGHRHRQDRHGEKPGHRIPPFARRSGCRARRPRPTRAADRLSTHMRAVELPPSLPSYERG